MAENAERFAEQHPLKRSASLKWLFLLLLCASIFASYLCADSLVDELPRSFTATFAFVGFTAGAYFVWLMRMRLRDDQRLGLITSIGLPLFGIYVGAFFGRLIIVAIAFTGFSTSEISVEAPIVNMNTGRSGQRAVVAFDPNSRLLYVRVDQNLYQKLDAIRFPGRDCLILTIQTGRFGIRRALLPSPLDDGIGAKSLRPCAARVSS